MHPVSGSAGRRRAVLATAVVLLLAFASLARAELVERGNLFVTFRGGLEPAALPRDSRAPIGVSVTGTVRTLSGERPPALRQIAIELNRGGVLDARGLPRCGRGQIESASSQAALAECRDALVGTGTYLANTAFPEQGAFPSNGRILAFNAVVDGHRAILAHVYGTKPVPITRIIVFDVRRSQGTYGTVLSGELPPSVNRYGYVKRISLTLHRRFVYRGQVRSYLSAACPAPRGFSGATFSFARASMGFADGRTLASTLTRSCRVRGGS
jgi:hypothetical protein